MAILSLRFESDPILSTPTEPIIEITPVIKALINDMFDTMYANDGIGLAANQVGVSKQIFVMDIPDEQRKSQQYAFLNPQIIWLSPDLVTSNEGCLSVPGGYANVVRSQECHLHFTDIEGKDQILKASDLMAACIQHEVDHLKGILFTDHLTKLKRSMVISKSRKSRNKAVLDMEPA